MNSPVKNSFGFHSLNLSIVILLVFLGINVLGRKASSTPQPAPSIAAAMDEVEETVTLTSPKLKTWQRNTTWHADHFYCPDLVVGIPLVEVPDGQLATGTIINGDRGADYLGCPVSRVADIRGSVWFDLSEIVKKAPVYVTSATLNFKKIALTKYPDGPQVCSGELMIARRDWIKDYTGEPVAFTDDFIPGADPLPIACGSEDCSLDVRSTVNNWIKGSEDRYGWVIARPGEHPASESMVVSQACLTRYGEFSLRVTYKYNKAPSVIYVPAPDRPVILLDTRKNVALAANGGMATASSELDSGRIAAAAINGDRWGLHWGSDPATGSGWHDATKGVYPDWLQVQFNSEKTINEVDVFTVQDNVTAPSEPKPDTGFTQYGITNFELQYWNGSAWAPILSSLRHDNKLVWNKITFPSIKTTKIRIFVTGSLQDYSRIVELEAWGN